MDSASSGSSTTSATTSGSSARPQTVRASFPSVASERSASAARGPTTPHRAGPTLFFAALVRSWQALHFAATFSPDLADLTIYVISVCQGGDIPRKGGPGITRSDFLVVNKADLAPHVNVNLEAMEADARRMRGQKPFAFTDLSRGKGLDDVIAFILEQGGLAPASARLSA